MNKEIKIKATKIIDELSINSITKQTTPTSSMQMDIFDETTIRPIGTFTIDRDDYPFIELGDEFILKKIKSLNL